MAIRLLRGPPGVKRGKARVLEHLRSGELADADDLLTELIVFNESDPELQRLVKEVRELREKEAISD